MAAHNNGLLGGLNRYPEYSNNQVSLAHPDTVNGLAPYVSPRNIQNKPYQAVPRVADTLFFSHQDKIRQMLDMIFIRVEEMDGWEFVFAPRTPTTDMVEVVTIRTMDDYVLENTAELTAPRVLDLREEQYSISLEHYQLGLKVYGENFRTPEGARELADKMKGFINATVITQKLLVKAAVINAPNYWMQQFSMTQRYNNILERTEQERQMFGALTKDPKGLYKIYSMIPEFTKYAPRQPSWNMCVVPPKLALQHQWRHDGTTEAWRVGDALAQRNKTSSPDVILSSDIPLTVYIDKEFNPVNADNRLPIDAFKRRAQLGAYAVLEYCDKGPVDPISGQPCPTVRCVTMPENNYTEFSMRDCIHHCARFDVNGSIDKFTQNVINMEDQISKVWDDDEGGYNRAMYDPWVYEPVAVGGGDAYTPHLKVCELFGEQDTRHRPEEFDVQQGKKFAEKLNLTDEEKTQIGLLFDAAQHLYEIPLSASTANDVDLDNESEIINSTFNDLVTDDDGSPVTDDEWGGPYFDGDAFADDASTFIPYGMGDIFAVMSMLKHMTRTQRENLDSFWSYGPQLKYDILRKALYKIWKQVKEMFPMLSVKNADAVPSFRKAGNKKDNNEMISVFRGLFERVKHPVWSRNTIDNANEVKDAADFDAGTQAQILAIMRYGHANLAGRDLVKYLKSTNAERAAAQGGYVAIKSNDMANTLNEEIDYIASKVVPMQLPATQQKRFVEDITRTAAAITMQYLIKKSLEGNANVTRSQLDQVFDSAIIFARSRGEINRTGTILNPTHAARRDLVNDEYVNTKLTVWKDAYGNNARLKGDDIFVATNARIGDVPLAGRTTYDDDREYYAQAHLTRQTDEEYENRGAESTYGVFERPARLYPLTDPDNAATYGIENFGADPAQFIDARRANEIEGAFLTVDLVDVAGQVDTDGKSIPQQWLVERQYMSRRANYIGKQLADNPVARLGAFCFIMSRVHRDSCLALLDHGLFVPMNFILAWPLIQIDTLAMMFAEGGAQTAKLNYGFGDLTNPEDGQHKIHEWNGTTLMGAGVINPMNYLLIPDAALAGYVSGLSSKFISKDFQGTSRGFKSSDPHNDGCFAMDVPVVFNRKTAIHEDHNPLPLFGKHNPEHYVGIYSRRGDIFNPKKPHFASWPAYNAHFKFDAINENARYSNYSYRMLRESRYIPGTMFLRNTQTYNPMTGEYHFVGGTRGTGHLDDIDPDKVNFKAMLDGAIEFRDSYASFGQ